MRKSLSVLLGTFIVCIVCGIVFAMTPLFARADISVGFRFSADSAGWYIGTNDVAIERSDDGTAMKLTLQTVDGNGPIILSSATSIDAANNTMTIELKNNSNAASLQLFFAATVGGFTGDGDTVVIPITQEDVDYKTYTIDMSTCAKWSGTIVHFRLDIKGTSGNVDVKSILFSGKAGEQPDQSDFATKFDFSADSAGWYLGTEDLAIGRTADNSAMALNLNGANPIILSSETRINADTNKEIVFEIKNTSNAASLQLFFAATVGGFTGDGDTFILNLSQNDEAYQTYKVDMSAYAKWSGTIVHFRLDVKGTSGTVEIKSISFCEKTKPVEPEPEPVTTSEFDFKQGANGWGAGAAATLTEGSEGIVCGYNGTSPDAFIVSPALDIPTTKKYMTITLKNESAASAMRLFFAVEFKENINDTNCVSFGILANSTEFKTYTVDMSRHPSWDGSLLFRLDLNGSDEVASGTITIDSINFTETAPEGFDGNVVKYDFSSSLSGWCNIHNAEVEQKDGYALLTIKGGDPLMCSQPGLGISAEYKYIRITMRSDIEAKQMALYFQTDSMGLGMFNERALLYFKTEKTDDFVTYVFDASECSEWSGFIFMIRFDFNDEVISSGTVAIKTIEFAKTSEPGYQVKDDSSGGGIVYPEDPETPVNPTPGGDNPSGGNQTENKGGCGGSVSSGLFVGIVLLAAAAVCLKRKKQSK